MEKSQSNFWDFFFWKISANRSVDAEHVQENQLWMVQPKLIPTILY